MVPYDQTQSISCMALHQSVVSVYLPRLVALTSEVTRGTTTSGVDPITSTLDPTDPTGPYQTVLIDTLDHSDHIRSRQTSY